MNKSLDATFDSLEQSLDRLIESITTYNPSPSAAAAVIAADDNMTAVLEELSVHQCNARSIQALRAQSVALDVRIKASLGSLAEVRADLVRQSPRDANKTPMPGMDYRLLVNTAQRIAPQTRPPVALADAWSAQAAAARTDDAMAAAATNQPSQSQTNIPTTTQSQSFTVTQSASEPSQIQSQRTRGLGKMAPVVLEPDQHAYLDTSGAAAAIFTPWPNESAMWAGALGRLHNADQNPVASDLGSSKAEAAPTDDTKPLNNGASARITLSEEEIEHRRREAEEKRRAADEELGQFDLYDPEEE